MKPIRISRRLIYALVVSAIAGAIAASTLTMIVLHGGTHATYCPSASAFWIFRCVPTLRALLMFGWVSLLTGMPVFMFLIIILGIGRR
ncbi:Hypothetical protein NGAL_HAMBI1146_00140 [Neorhizobium galegae bv. officinalis]|nr:Hypothetical protein NGAL_HAMBI1146_00140 [Neorhizobium galegae bv. officinalis]